MNNATCRICGALPTRKGLSRAGLCGACKQRADRLGYETPRPLRGLELFWSKVDKTDSCWFWTGSKDAGGYGIFGDARPAYHNTQRAHRIAYIEVRGMFDPELSLDHLCHTRSETCVGGSACSHRACVNPDHLEPVPVVENCMRGLSIPAQNARLSCCTKCGRPFDTTLKNGWRMCSPCQKARMVPHNQKLAERRKAQRAALREQRIA